MESFIFDMGWKNSELYLVLSAYIYFTLLLLTSLRVIIQRKPIGVSLAWLFLIYSLPLFGIISYFIFGELHLGKKRQKRRASMSAIFQSWIQNEVSASSEEWFDCWRQSARRDTCVP